MISLRTCFSNLLPWQVNSGLVQMLKVMLEWCLCDLKLIFILQTTCPVTLCLHLVLGYARQWSPLLSMWSRRGTWTLLQASTAACSTALLSWWPKRAPLPFTKGKHGLCFTWMFNKDAHWHITKKTIMLLSCSHLKGSCHRSSAWAPGTWWCLWRTSSWNELWWLPIPTARLQCDYCSLHKDHSHVYQQ